MSDKELFSLVLLTVVAMVVMALCILLIFNVSQKRIFKEVSLNQEKEIQFQQKLLESNIETQEKERNKIARELHDEICSKLNVVNLNLSLLEQEISKGNDVSVLLDQIDISLKNSIERTRDISHELMPPILSKFGIQSAISSLATNINMTGKLKVNSNVDKDWGELSKMDELHFYRIFQELLNNTLKHSQADNAYIDVLLDDHKLEVVYKDDGIGIDPDKLDDKANGIGMMNIDTRVKLIGAEKHINYQANNGFEIKISKNV